MRSPASSAAAATPGPRTGEEETVIAQLREIKTLLAEIKAARHHPAERAPEENNPPPES